MSRPAPDPMAVLRGHHGEVQALDFLDNEQLLLTGDAEGEIRAWDLQELRPISTCRAHPVGGGVLHLRAFGWQGQHYVVSQGKDMAVHVWRLGPGLQLPRSPLHTIPSLASSFCRFSVLVPPPSQAAAAGGSSGAAAAGLAPPRGSQASNAGCSQEPGAIDRGCVASAASSGTAGGALSSQQAAAEAAAEAAAPAADGAVPCCLEHNCQGWLSCSSEGSSDPGQQQPEQQLTQEHKQQQPMLALPAEDNSAIELWCCACGRQLAVLGQAAAERKLGMLTSLQLFQPPSSGAVYLAAGYEAGWVAVWAVGGGSSSSSSSRAPQAEPDSLAAEPLAARQLHEEPVLALDMDPSVAGGVSGGADARLSLFKLDLPAGVLRARKAAALSAAGVNDVAVRGDGRIVAAAGWDGRVRVFKCRDAEPLAVLKYHRAAVSAVRFSPTSFLLASASRDGTVALWSLYQPKSSGGASGAASTGG